ncbi:VWD domain-containing protein [[Phormidium] sp. ETS-05]|uniref:VWD domain-containing protein n=1 Tax=[Phormidium] sp. ETS-05 TaxID=222819 RepID=UPI0018EED37D|nr:VWD domain-containing protein [[Phormidium] sp. ETS-05]
MESTVVLETATKLETVDLAWQAAQDLLKSFATEGDYDAKMQGIFGDRLDGEKARVLAASWAAGDFSAFPAIEVRDSAEINGAWGAFAQATGKIYLSRELVKAGDVGAIGSVLLEEYGHYIDAQVNYEDALGDEGALFAASVEGQPLNESDILTLKAEDDSAVVVLDGQEVRIEQQVQSDTLDFFAKEIKNWTNSPLEDFQYKFYDEKMQIPESPVENSVFKLTRGLDFTLKGSVFATPGNLGDAAFSYNLPVYAELPSNLSLNEKFSIDVTPNKASVTGSFDGSQGLQSPDAGIKFESEIGKATLKDIEIKNPFNSAKPFQLSGLELGGLIGKQELIYNMSTYNPGPSIDLPGDVGTISVNLPSIEELTSTTPKDSNLFLPSIAASGTSQNIVDLEIDIDRALSLLYPPLKALGNEIEFPNSIKEQEAVNQARKELNDQLSLLTLSPTPENLNDAEILRENSEQKRLEAQKAEERAEKTRTKIKFGYDLLDLKFNGGFALQQNLELDPEQILVTMSAEGQPDQQGILGDPNTKFEFQTPSTGCGVFKVQAKYELQGDVENNIGAIAQATLGAEAVKLTAEASIFGAKLNSQIGPALSLSKNFTSEPFPLIGSDSNGSSRNPAYIQIQPKNLSEIADADKNILVKVEYKIPYNLPISIFDATPLEEGDSNATGLLTFTVKRKEVSNEPLTLSIEVGKEGDTAQQGSDYFLPNNTVTIPAGKQEETFIVAVVGDEQKEEPKSEFLTVTLKDPSGKLFAECKEVDSVSATGTIIDDDEKPKPPEPTKTGDTHNDPRLVTFDKKYYDFQAAGEFILAQSTTADLKIQVRQEPVGNNPLTNVSINTAVATVLGGKRIGIYKDNEIPLLVDGAPTTIVDNSYITIGDGRIYREGNIYTLVYANGEQLVAKVLPQSRIDIKVFLAQEREGKVVGILGNNNNDGSDDIAKRDGTVLTEPISIEQLYGEYADSWRITQAESLFDYDPGQDTNTFTLKNYPRQKVTLADLNQVDVQKAYQLIGDRLSLIHPLLREGAIIDFILTDFDDTVIQAAIEAEPPESALITPVALNATDDSAYTTANTPVNIEVLLNDTGTIGVPLAISNFDATTTAGGTLQRDNNNTPDDTSDDKLTYTPPVNFTGTDSFNYTLTDGTETDTAKVTITVPEFNLSTLNGGNGFVLKDTEAGSFSGVSVSKIGDFNGDNIDDLIVGAFAADPNGSNAAGKSFVVFGTTAGFPADFDLSTLNGSNGFVLNGIDAESFSGGSVSSAGDINNDGFDDVIVGAFGAAVDGKNNAGKTYILFGSNAGFSALNLSELNGSNGFVLNGTNEFDYLGLAVSSAGDINDDDFDDILIGVPGAAGGGSGKTYILFGRSQGFAPSLNLTEINGDNGFVINNAAANAGISVSKAGDINSDGIADLIIGTEADPNSANTAGESYVVFGSSDKFPANLNLSELNGSNGFILNGIDKNSGTSVSSAGDINGDGIDDLMVAENAENALGKNYIVFGSNKGFAASLDLSKLDGKNGFLVFNGIDGNSITSVNTAGDMNGDGIDDIALGVSASTVNDKFAAGKTYIMFGNNGGFPAAINLSKLDGSNGFVLNGAEAEDLSGTSVSEAGDINNDGTDDLVIGSPGSLFNNTPGKSYAVFGSNNFGNDSSNLAKILFNPGFYLKTNPDVAAAVESGETRSASEHFNQFGFEEGRVPSAIFADYLNQNPDVAAAVNRGDISNGFEHFIKYGFAEGRLPNSEFSLLETFYLAQNPDVAESVKQGTFASGLEHLIRVGLAEGRNPLPSFNAISQTFNAEEYLAQNPDVAEAVNQGIFRNGFEHFVKFGLGEGRDPSSTFSNSVYLASYPDVAEAVNQGQFRNGFDHFMKAGFSEDRSGQGFTFAGFDGTFGAFEAFNIPEETASNDPLTGNAENDILTGDAADNILNGELTNDPLTGDSNSNVFALQPGGENNVIAEFEDGIDFLGLANGVTFEQLAITPGDGATLINLNGQPLASLTGVEASNISQEDFILI